VMSFNRIRPVIGGHSIKYGRKKRAERYML
jgi:hypothetical protein